MAADASCQWWTNLQPDPLDSVEHMNWIDDEIASASVEAMQAVIGCQWPSPPL